MVADFIDLVSNSLTITVLVAYVFALWAALVVWAWIDISNRSDNVLFRLGAVLIVATGALLGFAIYLLLRPTMSKEEAQLREVEETILASHSQFQACPKCHWAVREDYSFCPNCSEKLVTTCVSCDREINLIWNVCAFCGTRQKERGVKAVKFPAGSKLKERGGVFLDSVSNFIKKINAKGNFRKATFQKLSRPKNKKTARTSKRKAA